MRTKVIAGNWKMNNDTQATKTLIGELAPLVKGANCEVVVCPSFVNLTTAVEACAGTNIGVGAQNCHFEKNGAFTGETSTNMLTDIGVKYTLTGHSERRTYFGDTDETVGKRTKAAVIANINAIFCVGETLEQREQSVTNEICALQTKVGLGDISAAEMSKIIIAYEPVWAIGTGKTATAEQAEEVCAFIREVVAEIYDENVANAVRILYGGSMNAANAAELLGKPNIDGGLIGGASLKAEDFAAIVAAAK